MGIASENVSCKDGLKLVLKKTNNNPACVKPQTLQKLIDRGWALNIGSSDRAGILVDTFKITLADNEKTFEIYSGDRIILNLSTKYTWGISVDNDKILKNISDASLDHNTQGIYESIDSGKAVLSAIGTPICLPESPTCDAPLLYFKINLEVQ